MTDPHDTIPMTREDIDRAFEEHRRQTLPLGIQAALAESQGHSMKPCPACGCGMVPSEVADRVELAMGPDFDEDPPITAVDDVTTQPVRR